MGERSFAQCNEQASDLLCAHNTYKHRTGSIVQHSGEKFAQCRGQASHLLRAHNTTYKHRTGSIVQCRGQAALCSVEERKIVQHRGTGTSVFSLIATVTDVMVFSNSCPNMK